jgi:hypothetical protein
VKWLNHHWEIFDANITSSGLKENDRKIMLLFFAEYFSDMIKECGSEGLLSKLIIPKLLENKIQVLNELINSAEEFRFAMNKLKLDNKKHDEQFNAFIKKYEAMKKVKRRMEEKW